MRAQTGLVRRGGLWWFRRRIPKDLLKHYGRGEHHHSLRTSDRAEAERLARLRAVELDHEYASVRAQLQKQRRPLRAEDLRRLSAMYVTWRLRDDDAVRRQGFNDQQFAEASEILALDLDRARQAVARGKPDVAEMLEVFLHEYGFELDPTSESYVELQHEIAKADVRASLLIQARDRGEPIDTPESPDLKDLSLPAPAIRKPGTFAAYTLEDLSTHWKQQQKPRPKTIIEADSAIARFRVVNGDLPPVKVTRDHVIAFRESLTQQGKAPATVKKLLNLLRGMFQVATEDGRFGVQANPFKDVKVRGKVGEVKARKPFSPEDLTSIFKAPVFTKGDRPVGGAGEAAYWIPLIGLFTGARLNEIGQLRVPDVKQEKGVPYIYFTNEGEGQHLKKGRKSRKRVPVHPKLVRLGFLRYVKDLQTQQRDRLFPRLQGDAHRVTAAWSKWWNRYLDTVIGITDPAKDFHSFRHTFKLQARACGIPEDQHDALTGHANASVSRAYGGAEGYPLAPLAKSIAKLRFPGFKL